MMKYFLNLEGLNSTYKGIYFKFISDGINTYGIVVILVAVIRHLNLTKQDNIVIMVENILTYLVHEFDQKIYGIDLRNKK